MGSIRFDGFSKLFQLVSRPEELEVEETLAVKKKRVKWVKKTKIKRKRVGELSLC